jgi:alkanesulfonate monooxygenase SsuD/methylene tetrahydromethanopterin reductase-like flavin-dependent oxidoreductase (luciferase family)
MLKFAIFDHLDSDGGPLGQFFENRLRLLGLIEQSGFHGYHMAEHHSTPLGMAGSPSVFLAAAIQRTSTIRIGPLVYVPCASTKKYACSTISAAAALRWA